MDDITYDVAIIGAGPAGLTSALYCGRANLSVVVFGNMFDSQMAKAGEVENYPGVGSIKGIDLIEKFNEQIESYKITMIPSNIARIISGEQFKLYSDDGEYSSRSVIIATGSKHRELNIPGEKEFIYKGVTYCAICDGALYKDKKVALIGQGDNAAKAALYLAGLCKEVIILTDKPELDAPEYGDKIKTANNVNVITNASIVAIEGSEYVDHIRYQVNEDMQIADVDGVFIEGGIPNALLAIELGLILDDKGNIKVDRPDQTTTIPGVFAAGDVTGGIHQISKSVGEGASAAVSAINYMKKSIKLKKTA